jgi:hypothetical protein
MHVCPVDAHTSLVVLAAGLQALQTMIGSIERRIHETKTYWRLSFTLAIEVFSLGPTYFAWP